MRLKAQEDPVEIIKILIMMDVSITAVEIVVNMMMMNMITQHACKMWMRLTLRTMKRRTLKREPKQVKKSLTKTV